jgi:tripeptide aminopeptidase
MSHAAAEPAAIDGAALDRIADDSLELCAIPAPTFAEGPRAREFARRLQDAGVEPIEDAVGNVIVRIGGTGPALAVCAHLDTVFGAEVALDVHRDGPILRGAGIGDNALGLAGLLHLARRLRERPTQTPVLLVGTVGEEGLGDLRGASEVVDRESLTGLLALEGHGLDSIAIGGVGSVRLRATYRGEGGHPWSDRGRGSATHAAVTAAERAIAAAAPAMVNIGTIRGGETINAIAEHAELAIDLRHPDPALLTRTEDRVLRALRAALPRGVEVEIEEIGRRPGGRTCDRRMIAAAQRARQHAGLGLAWEHDASTDANAAIGRGIPALTLGISRGGNAHRRDEWIALLPAARGLLAAECLVRHLAD